MKYHLFVYTSEGRMLDKIVSETMIENRLGSTILQLLKESDKVMITVERVEE